LHTARASHTSVPEPCWHFPAHSTAGQYSKHGSNLGMYLKRCMITQVQGMTFAYCLIEQGNAFAQIARSGASQLQRELKW
jgi:hypothetical protein